MHYNCACLKNKVKVVHINMVPRFQFAPWPWVTNVRGKPISAIQNVLKSYVQIKKQNIYEPGVWWEIVNALPVRGNRLNVLCPKFTLRIFDSLFALPLKILTPESLLYKVFALQHKAFYQFHFILILKNKSLSNKTCAGENQFRLARYYFLVNNLQCFLKIRPHLNFSATRFLWNMRDKIQQHR